MAMNSSWDGDGNNSSTSTPSSPPESTLNTTAGDWGNATVPVYTPPVDLPFNSALDNSTITSDVVADDVQAANLTANQTSAPLLLSASDTSVVNDTAIANLTDPSISLMNQTSNQVASNPLPLATISNGSLVISGVNVTTQSTTPQLVNPNVMGNTPIDGNMWQAPGVIIGVGCLILGFTCIFIGTFLRIRARRKMGRPARRVRVMSGFDFNDGAEDDYQHNPWHKAHLGMDSNEKSGFDFNGPMTEMNSYRHSIATVYSTGDDEEGDTHKNYQHHLRVETGFAQ